MSSEKHDNSLTPGVVGGWPQNHLNSPCPKCLWGWVRILQGLDQCLCLPKHLTLPCTESSDPLSLLFSHQVVSDSSRPIGLQHVRLPCPSPSPRVCPSSCPLSQWCHPTISSSVTLFSFCSQSFPASGSFPISWLFTSGGQSIGASASASVLPMTIQGCFL